MPCLESMVQSKLLLRAKIPRVCKGTPLGCLSQSQPLTSVSMRQKVEVLGICMFNKHLKGFYQVIWYLCFGKHWPEGRQWGKGLYSDPTWHGQIFAFRPWERKKARLKRVSLKNWPESSLTQKSPAHAGLCCQLFLKTSKTACFLSKVACSYPFREVFEGTHPNSGLPECDCALEEEQEGFKSVSESLLWYLSFVHLSLWV